jgi:hypothetical protein
MLTQSFFTSWTGIVGYSIIESIEQMKNALYFRGDVAVSVSSNFMKGYSYSDNFTWPSDDKELHEQADLGWGISSPITSINHLVAVIGWGPCEVYHCNTGELIEAECWIGKYFLSFVALYL